MAKTKAPPLRDTDAVDQLNVLIPADLKRRLAMARVNTRRSMTSLVAEFLDKGLADLERGLAKAK